VWALAGQEEAGGGAGSLTSTEGEAEGSATMLEHSLRSESGPLRAVHLSHHKWPGGLVI